WRSGLSTRPAAPPPAPGAAHPATAGHLLAAGSAGGGRGGEAAPELPGARLGPPAAVRPPANPSGFHVPTRNKSVPRPNVKTWSPASKTPSPLVSSDQTAAPSGLARTTPILVRPSVVQLPTTKVSVLRPKWYTLSPAAVCSVHTATPLAPGRTEPGWFTLPLPSPPPTP